MATNPNLPAVIEASAKAQGLQLANVNLIMPTETFGAVLGEFDKITIETVRVDTSDDREVYEPNGEGKGFALTKTSLQKIASALSIQWHPQTGIVESTPTRSTEPRGRSRAKAIGIMQKPNGETVVQTEEKTIDIDVEYASERAKQEKYAEDGRLDHWEGKRPVKVPWKSEAEKQRHIELEVANSLKQKIRFRDELAVTGAKGRVIRAFLALKSTYTRDELSKPLAFPRVSLDSSKLLANPDLRQEAIARLPGNVRQIFGPSPIRNVTPEVAQIEPPTSEPSASEEPIDMTGTLHPAEEPEADPFAVPAVPAAEADPRVELRARLEEYEGDDYVPLADAHKAIINQLLIKEDATVVELQAMVDRIKTYRDGVEKGAKDAGLTIADFLAKARKPRLQGVRS